MPSRRSFLKFLGMAPAAVIAAPAIASATAASVGQIGAPGALAAYNYSPWTAAPSNFGSPVTTGYVQVVKSATQLAADRAAVLAQIEALNVSQGRRPDGYEWYPDGWGMVA